MLAFRMSGLLSAAHTVSRGAGMRYSPVRFISISWKRGRLPSKRILTCCQATLDFGEMIQRLILACALVLSAAAAFAADLPRDVVMVETSSSQYRFEVEVADDSTERSEGLMFRESLADNAGMLFMYQETRPVDFWMKNTPLSLDIVFVREDGTIARIAENTTPMSQDLIPSGEPVRAVLEVKAGTMRQLGVRSEARRV